MIIATGAKVLGSFKIGDNSKIGAGAVVLQEVPPNSTVVGIKARIVIQDGKPFIMYVVVLQDFNLLGIFITAIFPICGALRLARFNVQAGVPGYFIGLPITAAGGVLATLALYHQVFNPVLLAVSMLLLAFLMVSKVTGTRSTYLFA